MHTDERETWSGCLFKHIPNNLFAANLRPWRNYKFLFVIFQKFKTATFPKLLNTRWVSVVKPEGFSQILTEIRTHTALEQQGAIKTYSC